MKKISLISFLCTLAVSIILMVAGFFMPPQGVIDGSVITATGELLGFAALCQIPMIVQKGGDIELKKGDTSIKVNNPDK